MNTENSAALYSRAVEVMPGGNSRTAVYSAPYPVYIRSGSGARVTDADGVERLDFLNNSTTLIHGHAHPEMVAAITGAVGRGTSFGMPTPVEVEYAEALSARNETFEHVRFTSSGTEAVMMAVQAARAYTKRPKIAKMAGAYHGAYDAVAVNNDGSGSLISHAVTGNPEGVVANTVVIPFNDAEGAVKILREHAEDLACVLIDPVPWRIGLLPADKAYLDALRAFCDESGALLISDEVGSYRVGYHGAMHLLGSEADLTVLGKVIGGGMPIGAVAGRRGFMSVFDPSKGAPALPHSGSYNANPVSMTSGVVSLRLLTEEAMERIGAFGEQVREALRATIEAVGLDWEVNGLGSLFRVIATSAPEGYPSPAAAMKRLHRELLDEGIHLGDSGLGCISTPMEEADIAAFATAFDTSLRRVLAEARA
ncbi:MULTISPECIES: aspartate aminotransferase family protein [Streptomyces]|uniref:Aspartate aminotransferase family protein n=2 Tax=Streptomyces TaxID=1883 RepID=A0ABU2RFQ3_9ACTN|nr:MULTISPECIES: aspartate aminotransferase family protein [unclassified Streptomyces]MBK3592484.1 aspartate aminotransferase family protein [Streptomyces sp. MBT51]MDT0427322.1 aspartate aminotransferase family protein [Streptomyces sp. DSM 41770]